jgi:hypothetical protein
MARVLALVLAATAAACSYSYGSSKYDYGPSFERVPGYQPGYGSSTSSTSKYDDWRNYQGSFHHGPEQVP